MAEFPALPLWTDAYLSDTRHLTQAQHGAYLLLLLTAWRTPDCSLPDDDVMLARFAGTDLRTWKVQKHVVMQFFTMGEDGRWRQKRLSAERAYVVDKSRKRASAGRQGGIASAASKTLKTNETTSANVEICSSKTQPPTPIPNNIPPTPRKRGSDRKTTIAEDWSPSDDDRAYAASMWSSWTGRTGLTAPDLSDEAERFRLHHAAAGKRMTDWSAAWKTWVRNAAKFLEDRERQRPGSVPPAPRHDLLTVAAAPDPPAETDEVWRDRARQFRDRGNWLRHRWGPDLLDPRCRVPSHLRSLFSQGEPP